MEGKKKINQEIKLNSEQVRTISNCRKDMNPQHDRLIACESTNGDKESGKRDLATNWCLEFDNRTNCLDVNLRSWFYPFLLYVCFQGYQRIC